MRSMKMKLAALALGLGLASTTRADPKQPAVWPKVITQAQLAEFAKVKWPIKDLIDPARGLAIIDYHYDSARDDFKPWKSAKRLCGDDLTKRLPAVRDEIASYYKSADTFACQNRPGPPSCSFEIAYEYTTRTVLVFRPNSRGDLVLDTVIFEDGGSLSSSTLDQQGAWIESQRAKLDIVDCLVSPKPHS